MKLIQALTLAVLAGFSVAVKIPFIQSKRTSLQRRSGGTDLSVSHPQVLSSASTALTLRQAISSFPHDTHDLIYMANVTLGGVNYLVQLDTGSSDLWVLNSPTPVPNANVTSQNCNLTYGMGWAYGSISYVNAEFAGISVPSQAFLDVSSAQNPALSYGAIGLLGLGFDSLSNIDLIVNATGASTGRSLLYNLFQDNPSEPNFIALSLQSTSDDDQVTGSFAIGETEPQYSNVTSTNKIPTWPVDFPTRWNVLLDSFIVGTETYSVSTGVKGAPSNKAVVLLDSGTSYTYAPTDVCESIYGGVPGAQYNSGLGQWTVPCDAEIDMALQFDNQIFPIHPLDVSPTSLSDPSTCVGSFVPQSVSVGAGQFDWLIGDNVLRSVYTVYDFGDFVSSGAMGNPYIQMLSLVNPDQASVEFHDVRGGTPQNNITYNVSSGGSGSTTVTLSTDVADTIDKLSKYLPAMLAVMALNALVLVVLSIVALILLHPGRLSPMPMNITKPHTYQPVSMALTEDTLFAPPSPAFKGESRPGDRPKSVA
ncbi:aspartic peptidase domain-containing protein [Suillus cothurnatus]|nr:aspartic peptidase domain-containing protein [Suillus cothurnatus]